MKNKLKFIIPIVIAVIAIIVAAFCIDFKPAEKADIPSLVSTAQKYLIENNYEQAIAKFNKIIEIDPMNVDAYIGIADAYIGMGDTGKAIEWLEKGYALTGDERLKKMIDELRSENSFEETVATTVVETDDTTIENTIEIITETTKAVDEEVEAIRAQALEILSPFVPNKPTGEPNSILYAYYESYYGTDEVLEYNCFKCIYDENGNLSKETYVSIRNMLGNGFEKDSGNIITYLPEYSSEMFVRPSSGTIKKYAVLYNGGLCDSGIDDWYNCILHTDCTYQSNNKYEFDVGYNIFTLYIENNKIYQIDNSYDIYTESFIFNNELSKWEYLNDNVTPYKIGLPNGFDESIFELSDNEIEKTFDDNNEFANYINNN